MTIRYLEGDATAPHGAGPKIIAHACNDVGGWGAGFVLAVSKRWPRVEEAYRTWHRTGQPRFGLGEIQFVDAIGDIVVANMVAQGGFARPGLPAIRYGSLGTCLSSVGRKALDIGASVHMPRIGCGLAGGTWDRVEAIVNRFLIGIGVDVYVYDWRPS